MSANGFSDVKMNGYQNGSFKSEKSDLKRERSDIVVQMKEPQVNYIGMLSFISYIFFQRYLHKNCGLMNWFELNNNW